MKRLLTFAVVTIVAAVPAVIGLAGNPSFAESVPVRVPATAQTVAAQTVAAAHATPTTTDDKGGQTKHPEPGDHRGGGAKARPSASPTTSSSAHPEPGDDKGGLAAHPEPGDDKGGTTQHAEPGDDHGGKSGGHGSDDGPGHQ